MSQSSATIGIPEGQKQARDTRIIVNAEPHVVQSDVVSYEQLVTLAYPTPPSPDTLFTVTFRNAKDLKEGSLAPGSTVQVRSAGTIFNVKATGKS